MNVEQIVDYLKTHPYHKKNLVHVHYQEAKPASWVNFPSELHPAIKQTLKEEGIEKLYTHQNKVFFYYQENKNIVVTTPTASGKTLAYLLPLVQEKLVNPNARFLFLYPTKALAQDQLAIFRNWLKKIIPIFSVGTFDGDTPSEERRKLKHSGDFILSNPDMLHSGILPQHTQWKKFLENLRTVVLDEMHTYVGVYGSHVALLLRRLKRLLEHYGAKPNFIFSSATIANPIELAQELTGEEFVLVSESGAGEGPKYFLFYNPPVIDSIGNRKSSSLVAAELGTELLQNQIQTLFFTRSRKNAEVLSIILKQNLPSYLQSKIDSYRGGLLPLERREIEKKLKTGEILGLVSTNALEVGIDIGILEAVISVGYPGKVNSLRQQFGRSGRKKEAALAIFIASSSPIDQYIVHNPQFVIKSQGEKALINPKNLLIYQDQLKCAAFELFFKRGDFFGGYKVDEFLEELAKTGILLEKEGFFYWTSELNPAHAVSLRSASQDNFVIVDVGEKGKEKVIGEVDYFSAPLFLHEEAIYLHRGKHYFVKNLLWEERKAYVVPVVGDYYTDAHQKSQVFVLTKDEKKEKNYATFYWGELTVRTKAELFKKIKIPTMENIGWGVIHTPELEMPTQGAWVEFQKEVSSVLAMGDKEDKMARLAYLLKVMAPLLALCDTSDIEVLGYYRDIQFGEFALVFYDNYPGGVGLAYKLVEELEALFEISLKALELCPCEKGCPACVGAPIDQNNVHLFENPKKEISQILKDVLRRVYKRQLEWIL